MSWIAVGVVGGSALLKLGEGISQNSKASKIEKGNPYPTMPLQNEYNQNVAQAQHMAQTGLPQQQYNNQLNSIQQNQAGALSALSGSANPGAGLANIVRSGDNATGALNAQDAVARNQNMLRLLQQRQMLAQQKDKVWDWNNRQKYLSNLAQSQALRGAGSQNIGGALSDASSLGGTLAKGNMGSTMNMGQLYGIQDTPMVQQNLDVGRSYQGQLPNWGG